ncbi:hypothetical protein FHS18_001623 [Paenibacillus phyllosphaerae]|uniref:Copper amine oxidase-like N-terminal domain-containing protein n=1 Tax=Paenibacillus phyllosphaerae TaxID=274593 RepID=A0A7W5AVH3_9BACL|nr:stalk domain-containing protein [Paenibacillus phyllosphaerae]MBB3109560.1 hypothetical protein [Paenibacillus phyllosphaerae]
MSMKKTVIISVLAAAVSTSVVSAASAATITAANVQVSQSLVYINDVPAPVRTIVKDGVTLVSVRDLGAAAGALFAPGENRAIMAYINGHSIELHAGSATVLVDGEPVELEAAVENVNSSLYIELTGYVDALGVDSTTDDTGSVWIETFQKLEGAEAPVWLDPSTILVSVLTETGSRADYKVSTAKGEFTEVFRTETASELTASPDGKKAAYTDAAGAVYIIDLATKSTTKVTSDDTIKPELVWAADSSAIYFLQGDKGSVVAKLALDGTITKVLEDKVDYKSDLAVSTDGTKFVYTVIKPGAVTADASKPVESDDVVIDMTGTEPQLYYFDASVKDGKPVKLTDKADDKVFVGASAGAGTAFYVSSEEGKATSSLIAVSSDKSVKTLVGDKDVVQAVYTGEKLYALTATATGGEIIEVDPTSGTAKVLYTVSEDVSEIVAGKGTSIAIVENGQVKVFQDGKWKAVTK